MIEGFAEARRLSEVRFHQSLCMLTLTCLKLAQGIREKMREMGTLAGVPIEPPEQTELLDACVGVAGVIGGGVPGGTLPILSSSSNTELTYNSFDSGRVRRDLGPSIRTRKLRRPRATPVDARRVALGGVEELGRVAACGGGEHGGRCEGREGGGCAGAGGDFVGGWFGCGIGCKGRGRREGVFMTTDFLSFDFWY